MVRIQDSVGAPFVSVDLEKAARRLSAFCKAKGIASDAQLDAAVDSMTDAQVVTACKVLLKALFEVKQG
jgi:hypothetical protein